MTQMTPTEAWRRYEYAKRQAVTALPQVLSAEISAVDYFEIVEIAVLWKMIACAGSSLRIEPATVAQLLEATRDYDR